MSSCIDFDSILHRLAAELKKDELIIPSMPELVTNLSKQLNNNDLTVKELAQIINTDTSVTSQIVRLSQTLRYSNPGTTITSLPNAISRIGLNSSVSIGLALAIEQTFQFQTPILKNYCRNKINQSNIWCRIALTICKIKYVSTPPLVVDYIMLASALINIGILPFIGSLDNYCRDNYGKVDINLDIVEKYIKSIRVPLGVAILRHWKFDQSFEQVITLQTDSSSEFYVNSIPYAKIFYDYTKENNIEIEQAKDLIEMYSPLTDLHIIEVLTQWLKKEQLI